METLSDNNVFVSLSVGKPRLYYTGVSLHLIVNMVSEASF